MNGPVDIGIAAAGAALLGAAVAWRTTARRGARSAMAHALVSPSPSARMAALRMVAAEGVAPFSHLLKERAAVEADPEVQHLLAEVIAQSQWEPSADEVLVELRLWAHRELEAATAANPGRPAEPPAAERRARPGSMTWWERAPRAERPEVVLVTGAGGPAGVAAIRWLRAAGHRVVAVDADAGAVGLRLGDGAAVVSKADEEGFAASLAAAARAAGATVLVPTVAEELLALAAARPELDAVGLRSWLPEPDAVLDCIDKWRFAKVVEASKVASPATNLGSADGVEGPWVVKPRFGRGSRDVVFADDATALSYALERVPEPIVQTRLTGREFTADALVGRDGFVAGVVPRWRLETRGGISTRGETFADPGLVVDVAELLAALRLEGPANVQGFIDTDGVPRFTEVNPRFSGGLPLSLAAGADLPGEYVKAVAGAAIDPARLVYRPGVVMMRFFEDVFEG